MEEQPKPQIGGDDGADDDLYTVDEVASALRASIHTVRNAIRMGKLEAFKVGREYRVTQAALDAYVTAQTQSQHVNRIAAVEIGAAMHDEGRA